MMKTVPWHLVGVGPRAREAAIEAARRDGKTLGEWLDRVITRHTAQRDAMGDEAEGAGPSGRGAAAQADSTADGGEVLRPRFIRPRTEEETRVLHLRRTPGSRGADPRPSDPSVSNENAALLLLGEAAAEMERRAAQTSHRAVDEQPAQLEARLANLSALLKDGSASANARDGASRNEQPDFAANLGAAQHLRDSSGSGRRRTPQASGRTSEGSLRTMSEAYRPICRRHGGEVQSAIWACERRRRRGFATRRRGHARWEC